MPFVILDTSGKPLRDQSGYLIVLRSEAEGSALLRHGEQVRQFDPHKDKVRDIER